MRETTRLKTREVESSLELGCNNFSWKGFEGSCGRVTFFFEEITVGDVRLLYNFSESSQNVWAAP